MEKLHWQDEVGLEEDTPQARLYRLTHMANVASGRGPLLAVAKQPSGSEPVVLITVTLAAQFAFAPGVVKGFESLAQDLLSECHPGELEDLKRSERARGNSGVLSRADQRGLLRLVLPLRIVPRAKTAIAQLFQQYQPAILQVREVQGE